MTPHPPHKPRIGKFVDYFNPKLMQRIGYTQGYGERAEGPYAALVVNNLGDGLTLLVYLPGVTPMEMKVVPYAEEPRKGDEGYWEWQTSLEKARAAKKDGGEQS